MAPSTINLLRTLALFALVGLVMLSLSWAVGAWIGLGIGFVAFVTLFWFCWFAGDRHLLSAYGAKPLTRKQAPELYRYVQELAKAAEMPRPRLYGIKSPAANSFSTGRDRHSATLVVTQGLLDLLSGDELEAVVAHELGIIYRQDCQSQTVVAVLAEVLSWPGRVLFFKNHRPSGNPIGSLLALLFAPLTAICVHIGLSQGRKLAADEDAARLTRKPTALARALDRLDDRAKQKPLLANPAHQGSLIVLGDTSNIFSNLFATHPATRDRLEQLDIIDKDMIRRQNNATINAMNL